MKLIVARAGSSIYRDVGKFSTPVWTRVLSVLAVVIVVYISSRYAYRLPGGEASYVVADLSKRPTTPMVALTFDDGPDPRFTPAVLNILNEKNVKATFFLVGKSASRNPELVMMEHLDGHEIANHTWSHASLDDSSWDVTIKEIAKTQDTIMDITGQRTTYFRPPRGKYDLHDVTAAKAMGYKIVMWTVGIETRSTNNPGEMVERVLGKVRPGSVILLHDGLMDRKATIAALPLLIDNLKDRGYKMVTISELLRDRVDITPVM